MKVRKPSLREVDAAARTLLLRFLIVERESRYDPENWPDPFDNVESDECDEYLADWASEVTGLWADQLPKLLRQLKGVKRAKRR